MTFPSEEERKRRKAENNKRYRERHKEKTQADSRARALRAYYADHEGSKAKQRAKYAERAEHHRQRSREYHEANRPAVLADMRERALWRKFKKTQEQYDELLEAQGGVCASCFRPPSEKRRLAWDHDHFCCPGENTCGDCIRGLLCTNCNLIIGKIELDLFDPQIKYLEAWL